MKYNFISELMGIIMKKITTTIILMVLALTLTGCGNNIVKKAMAPYSFVLSKII